MTDKERKELIGKRSQLFRRLLKHREILPGSLTFRQLQCGYSNCVCRREGKRHPSYQYSYKQLGQRKVTRNIPKSYVPQLEHKLESNKEFKQIMREIQAINLELLYAELEEVRSPLPKSF